MENIKQKFALAVREHRLKETVCNFSRNALLTTLMYSMYLIWRNDVELPKKRRET